MVFRRTEEIPMSPRNKRQVNEFVASELLYEFSLNSLDQERTKAVKEYISSDPSMQKKLIDIKYGLTYAEALGKTTFSQELENRFKSPPTYLSELKNAIHFEQWPTWAKWSSESVLIGSIVAIAVSFIPWHMVFEKIDQKSTSLVLAEVDSHIVKPGSLEGDTKEDIPLFADEKLTKDENTKPAATAEATQPTTTAANKKIESPVTISENSKTKEPNTTITQEKPKTVIAKTQGVLYRATLYVSNLDATSTKITKLIEVAGGRKAGSVPLGWSKDTERYYHFTIPSAQFDSLQKDLAAYGKFSISKEKHPRIMPEGISRVIISIFEANPSGIEQPKQITPTSNEGQ